jgi:hypothetical protein
MSLLNVVDGTRSDSSPNLCHTCRRALWIQGAGVSQEQIRCNRVNASPIIPFKVVKCSGYYTKLEPCMDDYYETALILDTSEKKQVGFVTWKQFKDRHPGEYPKFKELGS